MGVTNATFGALVHGTQYGRLIARYCHRLV
jgi:hypothetical protein